MCKAVKIGPWGGAGGQPCDVQCPPCGLVRVVVRSSEAINAITLTYVDSNGELCVKGPCGGSGGDEQPAIELGDSGYLKEISGTVGPCCNVPTIVTSLKIVTNKGETYEYGRAGAGGSFHIPVEEGQIVGFFGRCGDLLDAIGVYVRP